MILRTSVLSNHIYGHIRKVEGCGACTSGQNAQDSSRLLSARGHACLPLACLDARWSEPSLVGVQHAGSASYRSLSRLVSATATRGVEVAVLGNFDRPCYELLDADVPHHQYINNPKATWYQDARAIAATVNQVSSLHISSNPMFEVI